MEKIFVAGSLNMDLVLSVGKMPQKGETVMSESFFTNCGGKGANQAAAAAKLGGSVYMIGSVGTDGYGAEMKRNLGDLRINVSGITEAHGSSGLAFIILSDGDNRIILDGGANSKLTNEAVDLGLRSAEAGDILIAQNEIPLSVTAYAIESAKKKGMTVMFNPAPAAKIPDALIKNVDILFVNETEAEIVCGGMSVEAFKKTNVKRIVLTLGEKGSVIYENGKAEKISAVKVKAIDTTAAGDTYIGAAAVILSQGKSLLEACEYATHAAALTVTKKGAISSIPTKTETEEFIQSLK